MTVRAVVDEKTDGGAGAVQRGRHRGQERWLVEIGRADLREGACRRDGRGVVLGRGGAAGMLRGAMADQKQDALLRRPATFGAGCGGPAPDQLGEARIQPDRGAEHDPGAAGEAAAQEAHDEAVGHQERDDGDGATRAGQRLVETGLALEAGDADVDGGLARAQGIGVGQGDAGRPSTPWVTSRSEPRAATLNGWSPPRR